MVRRASVSWKRCADWRSTLRQEQPIFFLKVCLISDGCYFKVGLFLIGLRALLMAGGVGFSRVL